MPTVYRLVLLLKFGLILTSLSPDLLRAQSQIAIHNRGTTMPEITHNLKGDVGDFNINNHYGPALKYYQHGIYTSAMNDLDYFIERAHYLDNKPNKAELMSNAHFLRAMIYFYHASGLGRLVRAKQGFEQSIRWNSRKYESHLELARVWAAVGELERSVSILKKLLAMEPDEQTAEQARRELGKITAMGSQKAPQASSKNVR